MFLHKRKNKKQKMLKFFIFALTIALITADAPKPDKHITHPDKLKEAKCKDKKVNVPEDLLQKYGECFGKYFPLNATEQTTPPPTPTKPTPEEEEQAKEKFGCIFFCQGKADGSMTEEGKILMDKLSAGLEKVFPNPETKDIISGTKICLKTHGETFKMDEKAGKCKDILPFQHCYYKVIQDVCGLKHNE